MRADVAERRVHARRTRRERAGPVDENPDLLGVQPADRRIEVDRSAAHRGDPSMAAQRPREVLGDAPLDLRRRRDELRRQLRHERGDAHLLGERTDLERDGDVHDAGLGREPLLVRRETEQARREQVVAGRDAVEHEPAGPVRNRRPDEDAPGGPQNDGGAGQRQPLRIGHRARHRPAILGVQGLGSRQARQQERQQQHAREAGRPAHAGTHRIHLDTSMRAAASASHGPGARMQPARRDEPLHERKTRLERVSRLRLAAVEVKGRRPAIRRGSESPRPEHRSTRRTRVRTCRE